MRVPTRWSTHVAESHPSWIRDAASGAGLCSLFVDTAKNCLQSSGSWIHHHHHHRHHKVMASVTCHVIATVHSRLETPRRTNPPKPLRLNLKSHDIKPARDLEP